MAPADVAKPATVADYLASPQRAVALLNRVITSGGDLTAIRQAVIVVAVALKRAGLGEAKMAGRLSQWKHDGAKAKRT
jgi:hypothetical protein